MTRGRNLTTGTYSRRSRNSARCPRENRASPRETIEVHRETGKSRRLLPRRCRHTNRRGPGARFGSQGCASCFRIFRLPSVSGRRQQPTGKPRCADQSALPKPERPWTEFVIEQDREEYQGVAEDRDTTGDNSLPRPREGQHGCSSRKRWRNHPRHAIPDGTSRFHGLIAEDGFPASILDRT